MCVRVTSFHLHLQLHEYILNECKCKQKRNEKEEEINQQKGLNFVCATEKKE